MKREIIRQMKSELHMLEASSLPHESEKHLYAVETLLGLLKAEIHDASGAESEAVGPDLTDKDEKMLELMGGSRKKDSQPEDERTGDSIFDF